MNCNRAYIFIFIYLFALAANAAATKVMTNVIALQELQASEYTDTDIANYEIATGEVR